MGGVSGGVGVVEEQWSVISGQWSVKSKAFNRGDRGGRTRRALRNRELVKPSWFARELEGALGSGQ